MGAAFCIDEAFRRHRAEALATLIRLVGDFDLAEEGLQEAFAAAAAAWGKAPPDNPRAWLVAVGRRAGDAVADVAVHEQAAGGGDIV